MKKVFFIVVFALLSLSVFSQNVFYIPGFHLISNKGYVDIKCVGTPENANFKTLSGKVHWVGPSSLIALIGNEMMTAEENGEVYICETLIPGAIYKNNQLTFEECKLPKKVKINRDKIKKNELILILGTVAGYRPPR